MDLTCNPTHHQINLLFQINNDDLEWLPLRRAQQPLPLETQPDPDQSSQDEGQPNHPKIAEALLLFDHPRSKEVAHAGGVPEDQLQDPANPQQVHEHQGQDEKRQQEDVEQRVDGQ